MKALCCTKCGDVVIKSAGDCTKIRAKVLVMRENGAFAICKGCDSEIQIPVKLDEIMLKSIQSSSSLRLFIKK